MAFSTRCRELGITRSMGSVVDCFDNAMMESFFSSLEAEVLDRYRFRTRDEARGQIYNPYRRHSSFGYVSPREFERRSNRRRACHPDTPLPHPRETARRDASRERP